MSRTAERQDQPEVIQLRRPMTWQANSRVAGAAAAAAYPGGPVIAGKAMWGSAVIGSRVPGAQAGLDAASAVTALYSTHHRSGGGSGPGAPGNCARQYDAIHSTWAAGSSCTSPSWRSVRYTSHAPSTTEAVWKACSRSAP